MRSFYQDRLGTNIGKTLKNGPFSQGYPAVTHDSILVERAHRGCHWLPRHGAPSGCELASGELNVAYSDLDDADGTGGTFATIIGIDLPKPHTFTAQQLGFNHSTLLSFNGRVAVRKPPCLEPLLYETDHFTKAGFGQT
jgi:hypothetical protein